METQPSLWWFDRSWRRETQVSLYNEKIKLFTNQYTACFWLEAITNHAFRPVSEHQWPLVLSYYRKILQAQKLFFFQYFFQNSSAIIFPLGTKWVIQSSTEEGLTCRRSYNKSDALSHWKIRTSISDIKSLFSARDFPSLSTTPWMKCVIIILLALLNPFSQRSSVDLRCFGSWAHR